MTVGSFPITNPVFYCCGALGFEIGRTLAGASVYLDSISSIRAAIRVPRIPEVGVDEFWVTKQKRGLLRLKIAA